MIYRVIHQCWHWEVQIQGPYNWIAIADKDGKPIHFKTEADARCEMNRRIRKYAPPNRNNKVSEWIGGLLCHLLPRAGKRSSGTTSKSSARTKVASGGGGRSR